ncbi:hypothetical protein MMC20_002278 [Loxospora ochrophaea]|nr:hypothetical protein [Loxospora ochrophaea]
MSDVPVDYANLNASWKLSAHTYDRRLSGANCSVATFLISLLPSLPAGASILDNSCGTGAFSEELLKTTSDVSIHAVDGSAGMIEILREAIIKRGWEENVKAEVMDGQQLMFPDRVFDLSVTNFGIFFYPDPVLGAKEIHRTLKSGGIALVTCWKEMCWVPIFYEVQRIVKPAKHVELKMFEAWQKEETLHETMIQGGFVNVRMESKKVMFVQDNIDGLVGSLAIHLHDLVGQEWSKEEKEKIENATAEALAGQMSKTVIDLDGKVGLEVAAWIALAKK